MKPVFFANLNEREIETSRINRTELAPWDAHIVPVIIPPNADCIGKTLLELRWREAIGVNVVMIKRGDLHIAVPDKDQMIFPLDELLVLGTDHQIQKLRVLVRAKEDEPEIFSEDVELYSYEIRKDSKLIGKTIRESGLRERAHALVVGIERKDDRILNPGSDIKLELNDNLFVVANQKKVREFLRQFERKEILNEM